MAAPTDLRFCWWNVQDFAHFDPTRRLDRWPKSADEYTEKSGRLVSAFDTMYGSDAPDLIGLCEITLPAAQQLRAIRFQGHDLIPTSPGKPNEFQVVVLSRTGRGLTGRAPWFAQNVSTQTRPMGVVGYQSTKLDILFVVCHWPAFDEEECEEGRRLCAYRLRTGIYDFLHDPSRGAAKRHVIAFGDFNTEPHSELMRTAVYSSRDRDRARRRPHREDASKRRVWLYNCGWKLLGEQFAHGVPQPQQRRVGTYYRQKKREWRTYDQVLVSGGLLAAQPPYLDEGALLVRTDTGNLVEGKPAKFEFENAVGTGLSDHYPLTGRIVLG